MRSYQGYIFDLDGTVYLGEQLLPAAAATITHLRRLGARVLFASNNPTRTAADYAAKLSRLGLRTSPQEVITSSDVMLAFLQRDMPGARLIVIGEEALRAQLSSAGFSLTWEPQAAAAVIASFDRTFSYARLQAAFDAVRLGARFFATNADPFCPVPAGGGSRSVTGGEPDAAAVIAAIEASAGVKVEMVTGKPSAQMAAAALARLGLEAGDCLVTGDRLETDVRLGLDAGMAAALVLTGATTREQVDSSTIRPSYVLESLADLVPA